jgi:uncharacterized protein (UPF0548 family)
MLFLRRPTHQEIHTLLAERGAMGFSYPDVGATRSSAPAGYRINHLRALLGQGADLRARAIGALLSWQLLAVAGLELFPKDPPMQPQTTVALLSRHFGLWSLDFCRVIYVLEAQGEDGGAIERTGFAYGTLPATPLEGRKSSLSSGNPQPRKSGTKYFRSLARQICSSASPDQLLAAPRSTLPQLRWSRR